MLESLYNKVKLQAFGSSEHLFLKTSAKNGCLVRNMSLKTQKLDQGATDMFISEFEKEKSLWNVMSAIYKNRDAKTTSFKRLPELFEGLSFFNFEG